MVEKDFSLAVDEGQIAGGPWTCEPSLILLTLTSSAVGVVISNCLVVHEVVSSFVVIDP